MELPRTDEQDKAEADVAPEERPPQPRIPDLAKFDAEITRYKELGETIAALKSPVDIGWLRVNTSPIKAALASVVAAWVQLFTSHLQAFVSDTSNEMATFISTVSSGLEEDVSPELPGTLKRCMAFIRDVRKTRFIRKAMIVPLRKAATLLKKHGVAVDDIKVGETAVSEYLEQADLKVEQCINKTFAKKETIFPLQTAEMEKIKVRQPRSHRRRSHSLQAVPPPARLLQRRTTAHGRCIAVCCIITAVLALLAGCRCHLPAALACSYLPSSHPTPPHPLPLTASSARLPTPAASLQVRAVAFEDRVREFWNGFRKQAPFAFAGPVDEAYKSLDGFFGELVKLEAGARDLNEVEELFELPISKFNETGQCRVQLRLLKALWDFKALLLGTYDAWKTSLWADINTEALEVRLFNAVMLSCRPALLLKGH